MGVLLLTWRKLYQRGIIVLPVWELLSLVFTISLHLRCIPLPYFVNRRQDSSIGFGAPVRASMRAGGISSAQVTSSLLESVSTMRIGVRNPLFQGECECTCFVKPLCFQVESGDLIAYGLIPEFIGRFPILVSLAALNEDQLVQVA